MVTLEIKGTGRVIKSLGRYINWANKEIPNLTKTQAIAGARFLKQNMPKGATGAMQSAVSYGGRRGNQWAVISRQPKNGQNRNYHIFYDVGATGYRPHGTNNPSKTGYYSKTYNYLYREYGSAIAKSLNKIK